MSNIDDHYERSRRKKQKHRSSSKEPVLKDKQTNRRRKSGPIRRSYQSNRFNPTRRFYSDYEDQPRYSSNRDRQTTQSVRFGYVQGIVKDNEQETESIGFSSIEEPTLKAKTLHSHLYSIKNEKNSSQTGSTCVICSLKKDSKAKKKWPKEKPIALVSIIGGSDRYLPTDTIKNQLKNGLKEIMNTINIWIITNHKNTGIGAMVNEVIQSGGPFEKRQCHVFHEKSYITTAHTDENTEGGIKDIADCIIDHIKIPLILIIVGGKQDSFEIAMSHLKKNVPVLVIDGSGGSADFVCKGYRMSMHKKGVDRAVFSDTFRSEMAEAANSIRKTTESNDCEKLVDRLHNELGIHRKYIHVHSVNDTAYPLERTIQDTLLQSFCEDFRNKSYSHKTKLTESRVDEKLKSKVLHFVNVWNRPDIAEEEVFNLENKEVIDKLETGLSDPKSNLAQFLKESLVRNRVDCVRLVLEYIQDKHLYKDFLIEHLTHLYIATGCIAGNLISKLNRKKRTDIVRMINQVVIQILGSTDMMPFSIEEENKDIQEEDIFKHLFLWAVLMDRRDLAMLFWKKEDSNFICSALYASSLAKKLAKNSMAGEHRDQLAALWGSHRYFEDLAYSVMTEMYWKDNILARQLLVTEVKRYNCTTIFEISEKFELMKFIGHAACQTKLNQIWKGRITSETSILKVVIGAVIPILIMQMVKIKESKLKPLDETTQKDDAQNLTSTITTEAWRNRIRKIYYFYTSPLLKFIFSLLGYVVMLVLFSMFVLTDLHPIPEKNPSVIEYIVYSWAATTLLEEIRQAFGIKQVSLNLMTWFTFWTLFEILMYSLFITSVFLRLTLSAEDFYHARMMYSLTLGLFIINSMQFFLVSIHIGPKVIMIGRMMFDIIFFILIFAVFLFGFGVIYQATMFPNSEPGFQLFKDIIYMPYWQLYGELFLDNFAGKEPSTCTNDITLYRNGTLARCPELNQMNTVLLAIYMVVTHIILVNILIAMFSHTFTKVQDNNELVWKFHRFSLIREYYDRSSLIPPFIIISQIRRIFMCLFPNCFGRKKNKFKIRNLTEKEQLTTSILERDSVYRHLNASIMLRRYNAQNTESNIDGFETGYGQDTDISLQDQFKLLASAVDKMQKNQEETLKEVKQIKAEKQNVMIVELLRGYANQNYI